MYNCVIISIQERYHLKGKSNLRERERERERQKTGMKKKREKKKKRKELEGKQEHLSHVRIIV